MFASLTPEESQFFRSYDRIVDSIYTHAIIDYPVPAWERHFYIYSYTSLNRLAWELRQSPEDFVERLSDKEAKKKYFKSFRDHLFVNDEDDSPYYSHCKEYLQDTFSKTCDSLEEPEWGGDDLVAQVKFLKKFLSQLNCFPKDEAWSTIASSDCPPTAERHCDASGCMVFGPGPPKNCLALVRRFLRKLEEENIHLVVALINTNARTYPYWLSKDLSSSTFRASVSPGTEVVQCEEAILARELNIEFTDSTYKVFFAGIAAVDGGPLMLDKAGRELCRHIRKCCQEGKRVKVHCDAGFGRTGVFRWLCDMYIQLDKPENAHILALCKKMLSVGKIELAEEETLTRFALDSLSRIRQDCFAVQTVSQLKMTFGQLLLMVADDLVSTHDLNPTRRDRLEAFFSGISKPFIHEKEYTELYIPEAPRAQETMRPPSCR